MANAQVYIIAALLGICIILGVTVISDKNNANGQARTVCFSAELWDANDSKRPCYEVFINEDGSGMVRTHTLECNIPAGDSSDDYVTRCYRND